MNVAVSKEILHILRLTTEEFWQEVTILFYQQKRLTLAQASGLLGLDRLAFQRLLVNRQIPIHYDEQDLETDLVTLKKLNLL